MHKSACAITGAFIIGMWVCSAFAAPQAVATKKPTPPKFTPAKKEIGTAFSRVKPVLVEPLAVGVVRSPKLEIVYRFETIMPVGIAVTSDGRKFVSYPRWTDKGEWTLAEIKDDKEVPYPAGGAFQMGHKTDPRKDLVSLQGIITDGKDRLWIWTQGQWK